MKVYTFFPALLQRLAWFPIRILFTLGCSLKIRGLEHILAAQSNFILAANHTSELDAVLLVGSLPIYSSVLPLFFVSREKTYYQSFGWKRYIYGGKLFALLGALPAHVGLRNYKQALRDHIALLRAGGTVLIFPTGKIAIPGVVFPAKGGVSFLSLETGLPVIPVLIEGLDRLGIADILMRRRPITVTFGPPLQPSDLFRNSGAASIDPNSNEYTRAASLVMQRIAALARPSQAKSK